MRHNNNIQILVFVLCLACNGGLLADESSVESLVTSKTWKIVNYWSETCAPCRVEIPELNQLSQELDASKVIVLGVNFDENERSETLEIAHSMGITFPTLTQAEVTALNLKAPFVLPTTYILSPENQVKVKVIGAQDKAGLYAKLVELGISE